MSNTRDEQPNPDLDGVHAYVSSGSLRPSVDRSNCPVSPRDLVAKVKDASEMIAMMQERSIDERVVKIEIREPDGGDSDPTLPDLRREMQRTGENFSQLSSRAERQRGN